MEVLGSKEAFDLSKFKTLGFCMVKVFDQGSWVQAVLDPLIFYHLSVLWQDTSEPRPSTGET